MTRATPLLTALTALLLVLPACFLPTWDDRPWTDDDDSRPPLDDDDDDTGTDDDDTGTDDDDDTGGDLALTGTANINGQIWGYPASCMANMDGEVDAARTEVDGDGTCLLWGYLEVALELNGDLSGAAFDGTLVMYDPTGYVTFNMTVPMSGAWDEGAGTLTGTGSVNDPSYVVDANLNLHSVD